MTGDAPRVAANNCCSQIRADDGARPVGATDDTPSGYDPLGYDRTTLFS
jgi:hypothetical protein